MNKLKLKSGREIGIKEISLDERDEMLDSVKYIYDDDDNAIVEAAQKTITKWLRMCLNGQATDEFILALTFEERNDFFRKMQKKILTGKGNASNSK